MAQLIGLVQFHKTFDLSPAWLSDVFIKIVRSDGTVEHERGLHKVVLAIYSQFWRELFCNCPSKEISIVLLGEDATNVDLLLSLLYTGQVTCASVDQYYAVAKLLGLLCIDRLDQVDAITLPPRNQQQTRSDSSRTVTFQAVESVAVGVDGENVTHTSIALPPSQRLHPHVQANETKRLEPSSYPFETLKTAEKETSGNRFLVEIDRSKHIEHLNYVADNGDAIEEVRLDESDDENENQFYQQQISAVSLAQLTLPSIQSELTVVNNNLPFRQHAEQQHGPHADNKYVYRQLPQVVEENSSSANYPHPSVNISSSVTRSLHNDAQDVYQQRLSDIAKVSHLPIDSLPPDEYKILESKSGVIKREYSEVVQAGNKSTDTGITAVTETSLSTDILESCQFCSKCFTSTEYLKRHVSHHHTVGMFKCSKCDYRGRSKANLNFHVRNVHRGIRERCQLCSKTFSYKSALNLHISSVHLKLKKFKCEFCDIALASSGSLKVHTRLHTGERPFGCHNCGKTFMQSNMMNSHRKHCVVSLCQRKGRLLALNAHGINIRTSIGVGDREKPVPPTKSVVLQPIADTDNLQSESKQKRYRRSVFECKPCSKKFRAMHGLIVHMNKSAFHRNEKPFKCQLCEAAFFSVSRLNSHMHKSRNVREATEFHCRKNKNSFNDSGALHFHPETCDEGEKFLAKMKSNDYGLKVQIKNRKVLNLSTKATDKSDSLRFPKVNAVNASPKVRRKPGRPTKIKLFRPSSDVSVVRNEGKANDQHSHKNAHSLPSDPSLQDVGISIETVADEADAAVNSSPLKEKPDTSSALSHPEPRDQATTNPPEVRFKRGRPKKNMSQSSVVVSSTSQKEGTVKHSTSTNSYRDSDSSSSSEFLTSAGHTNIANTQSLSSASPRPVRNCDRETVSFGGYVLSKNVSD